MKVNQKKANKIMGMFATLNKIELDKAVAKENLDKFTTAGFTSFDCVFTKYDFLDSLNCELTSQKMVRDTIYIGGGKGFVYVSHISFGGHWPTTQTLWDGECKYSEFSEVVRFVRNAIRAGGLSGMKYATHKVTVDMPDYLSFELGDQS